MTDEAPRPVRYVLVLSAVVVTLPKPDPVVEAEAALFGAVCAVSPWDRPADLLTALARVQPAVAV